MITATSAAATTRFPSTRVIPQTGVTHVIRFIYIHDTAQGDEHDPQPSPESEPCGGGVEERDAETKFGRERSDLVRAECFHSRRTGGARRSSLPSILFRGGGVGITDMDALKSAGRAIIRSPSIAKQSWGSGRHKKLPENWTDTRETLLEGMVFQLKYLGVTMVEQPKGEELSAAAVKRIVATAKASGKKLQKVTLSVSPRGIILYDSASNQLIENISIYRISYCTADKMHDKVFAYIVQSQHNETLECHAFLCTKKKTAQAVTLTVAQAFRVAFEFWQAAKEEKEKRVKSGSDGEGASNSQSESSASLGSLKGGEAATGKLLDLAEGANMAQVHSGTKQAESDSFMEHNHATENNNTVWELEDGLDEAFSSRSLDSFESYSDSLSLALTPRSWTLG
ncbi:low density lipoprotein receptor adapter protein 1b isoform X2 [Paralichthys olivaceus]|uniref:low density lipoprotein receptor adapter protein 1b isoform X2 n=1 Tax=Paralichthys olivaceus TaxID=8255 RepID=UPI0037508843